MSFFDEILNKVECAKCKMGDNDACLKCKMTKGFSFLKQQLDKKTVLMIILIIAILMYMEILPNPFKSKTKQHLQYFFF